jgi:hypothetical protein
MNEKISGFQAVFLCRAIAFRLNVSNLFPQTAVAE